MTNDNNQKKRGRPTIGERAMTSTERADRAKNLLHAAVIGEADLAAQHIRAARQVGAKRGALHLTDALFALARLENLLINANRPRNPK